VARARSGQTPLSCQDGLERVALRRDEVKERRVARCAAKVRMRQPAPAPSKLRDWTKDSLQIVLCIGDRRRQRSDPDARLDRIQQTENADVARHDPRAQAPPRSATWPPCGCSSFRPAPPANGSPAPRAARHRGARCTRRWHRLPRSSPRSCGRRARHRYRPSGKRRRRTRCRPVSHRGEQPSDQRVEVRLAAGVAGVLPARERAEDQLERTECATSIR
jgi:hypothetical protein